MNFTAFHLSCVIPSRETFRICHCCVESPSMFLCPYSRTIALTTTSVQLLVYPENASGGKLRQRKPPHAEFAGCARTENRSQASGTSARSDTGFVQEKNCLDGDTEVCRNIRACLIAREQQGGLHVVSERIDDSMPRWKCPSCLEP